MRFTTDAQCIQGLELAMQTLTAVPLQCLAVCGAGAPASAAAVACIGSFTGLACLSLEDVCLPARSPASSSSTSSGAAGAAPTRSLVSLGQQLQKLPGIQELRLVHPSGMQDGDWLLFADSIFELSSLRKLHVVTSKLSDAAVAALSALTQLTDVDIQSQPVAESHALNMTDVHAALGAASAPTDGSLSVC